MADKPFDFLKNFQNMQGQFTQMQERLKQMEIKGSAGGGLVEVTLNGQLEVLNISIDPVAVDPRDVTMLEDLLKSAFFNASEKIKEQLKGQFSGLAGNMM